MEDKQLDWKERRLKLWLGFSKFTLGTFIIGMFVQWINWQIQSRQLEINAAKLNAILRKAKLPYIIDIYMTKIGGNFVITVGGRMSRAEANALAAKAKLEKWAADAFPQIDREWSIVKSYPSSP